MVQFQTRGLTHRVQCAPVAILGRPPSSASVSSHVFHRSSRPPQPRHRAPGRSSPSIGRLPRNARTSARGCRSGEYAPVHNDNRTTIRVPHAQELALPYPGRPHGGRLPIPAGLGSGHGTALRLSCRLGASRFPPRDRSPMKQPPASCRIRIIARLLSPWPPISACRATMHGRATLFDIVTDLHRAVRTSPLRIAPALAPSCVRRRCPRSAIACPSHRRVSLADCNRLMWASDYPSRNPACHGAPPPPS